MRFGRPLAITTAICLEFATAVAASATSPGGYGEIAYARYGGRRCRRRSARCGPTARPAVCSLGPTSASPTPSSLPTAPRLR